MSEKKIEELKRWIAEEESHVAELQRELEFLRALYDLILAIRRMLMASPNLRDEMKSRIAPALDEIMNTIAGAIAHDKTCLKEVLPILEADLAGLKKLLRAGDRT